MAHPYILWELSFKLDNVENKNTFFGISSYQKIEDRTCDPLFAKPCWIWRGCSCKKIVFRICLLSLLLLQTPETYARSNMNFSRADQYIYEKEKKRELEEIHCTSSIYIYMEEFVYWQYLRCKLQKRPVPVQTWIFQEQTNIYLRERERYVYITIYIKPSLSPPPFTFSPMSSPAGKPTWDPGVFTTIIIVSPLLWLSCNKLSSLLHTNSWSRYLSRSLLPSIMTLLPQPWCGAPIYGLYSCSCSDYIYYKRLPHTLSPARS